MLEKIKSAIHDLEATMHNGNPRGSAQQCSNIIEMLLKVKQDLLEQADDQGGYVYSNTGEPDETFDSYADALDSLLACDTSTGCAHCGIGHHEVG